MRWQGGAEVSGHVIAKSVVLPGREPMICLIARPPRGVSWSQDPRVLRKRAMYSV